jgi:hypothetical protein
VTRVREFESGFRWGRASRNAPYIYGAELVVKKGLVPMRLGMRGPKSQSGSRADLARANSFLSNVVLSSN